MHLLSWPYVVWFKSHCWLSIWQPVIANNSGGRTSSRGRGAWCKQCILQTLLYAPLMPAIHWSKFGWFSFNQCMGRPEWFSVQPAWWIFFTQSMYSDGGEMSPSIRIQRLIEVDSPIHIKRVDAGNRALFEKIFVQSAGRMKKKKKRLMYGLLYF